MTKQMILRRREELVSDVERYVRTETEAYLRKHPEVWYIQFEGDTHALVKRVEKGVDGEDNEVKVIVRADSEENDRLTRFVKETISFCKDALGVCPALLVVNPRIGRWEETPIQVLSES
jgi:hypothetical protein